MTTLFVVGLTAGSAPVEIRERLALTPDDIAARLAAIEDEPRLSEAVVVSTCNRIEVWGVSDDERGPTAALELLCRRRDVAPESLNGSVRTKTATAAAHHCFRVASGPDSVVVGEPQILGQVEDAVALARRCGTVGPILERLVTRAFTVAKRVRTETALGQHAVSVS